MYSMLHAILQLCPDWMGCEQVIFSGKANGSVWQDLGNLFPLTSFISISFVSGLSHLLDKSGKNGQTLAKARWSNGLEMMPKLDFEPK